MPKKLRYWYQSLTLKHWCDPYYLCSRAYVKTKLLIRRLKDKNSTFCPFCGGSPDLRINRKHFYQCDNCARRWSIGGK